jgi:hypothetical protein
MQKNKSMGRKIEAEEARTFFWGGNSGDIVLISVCLSARLTVRSREEIDRVPAAHYGFTDEELDFIINYDIKYRMGRDAEADDE